MLVASLSSSNAPTTTVSPDTATDQPNTSPASVLLALRYACCAQFVPVRTKTYAAPAEDMLLSLWLPLTPVALLLSNGAPTTTVSPDIATEFPNPSPAPVLLAFRYAC